MLLLFVTADAPYPEYCLDIYLIRFVSPKCLSHNDVIDFTKKRVHAFYRTALVGFA